MARIELLKVEDLVPGTLFRFPYNKEDEHNGAYNHNVCIRTKTGYLPFSSMYHIEEMEYPEYMEERVSVIGILPDYNK